MVHALEKIHRLLKPAGSLIDIHPTSEPATLEVRVGAQTHFAGWLHETDDYAEYEDADAALVKVVEGGLFAVERAGEFAFVWYADTLKELGDYLAEDWEDARIDAVTAARIEEWLATSERDKEVILRERVRINRLKPLPPP